MGLNNLFSKVNWDEVAKVGVENRMEVQSSYCSLMGRMMGMIDWLNEMRLRRTLKLV